LQYRDLNPVDGNGLRQIRLENHSYLPLNYTTLGQTIP